jgi:uncharacterized membrane protein
VALRQRRAWALAFGLLLQLGAALVHGATVVDAGAPRFLLHAGFLAVLLLAASALVCAGLLQRAAGAGAAPAAVEGVSGGGGAGGSTGAPLRWIDRLWQPGVLGVLHWALLALGVLHLVVGGLEEAGRAPWRWPDRPQTAVLWLVLLAVALEALHRRLRWPALAVPARPLLSLAALVGIGQLAAAVIGGRGWDMLMPAGAWALAVLLLAAGWVLRRLDADSGAAPGPGSAAAAPAVGAARPLRQAWAAEAVALGIAVLAVAGLAADAVVARWVAESAGWRVGASMAAPTAVAWAVLAGLRRGRWPTDRRAGAWLAGLAVPWLVLLLAWSAGVNAFGDGAMAPLPYLPLLNPIDLGHGLLLLYALRLRRALLGAGTGEAPLAAWLHRSGPALAALTAAMAFWWLTSLLVRTLHHWAGTPMWTDGALDSGLVQMALSILWTTIALATMVVAARRLGPPQARTVWLAGAGLLAVVVAKLLLVDLSQTSALQRIGSFVGVGLLMLVVGYVAPLPPARAGGHEASR